MTKFASAVGPKTILLPCTVIVFNLSTKGRDDALCELLVIDCSLVVRVLIHELILVNCVVRHIKTLQSD